MCFGAPATLLIVRWSFDVQCLAIETMLLLSRPNWICLYNLGKSHCSCLKLKGKPRKVRKVSNYLRQCIPGLLDFDCSTCGYYVQCKHRVHLISSIRIISALCLYTWMSTHPLLHFDTYTPSPLHSQTPAHFKV